MPKRGIKSTTKFKPWTRVKHGYSSYYHRHKKTTLLLTLIAIVLVIYGALILVEWTQFKLAEKKINHLYTDTLNTLGTPESKYIRGSCGYASAKFHKGDLGCGYGFSLTYKGNNIDEANEIANKVANIIESQKYLNVTYRSQQRPVDFRNESYKHEGIGYDLEDQLSRMGCGGGIGYETTKPKELNVGFSCNKSPVHKAFYKVEN